MPPLDLSTSSAFTLKTRLIIGLIVKPERHAAFVAYTRSLQCQWTFISRVIADLFEPLENAITAVFLKALLDNDINWY